MRHPLLFAAVAAFACADASAASFNLSLSADGSGRYYDYFSDAYAQIDQGFNGHPALDGFFLISTGTQIGGGYDVFPHEGAFANIGQLSYDDAGLSGVGLETASITGLSLDVNAHVDPAAVTGQTYSTTVSGVTGTVSLFNGAVSGITLDAGLTLSFDSVLGSVPYLGSFSIANNLFTLLVDDTFEAPGFGTFRQVWDLTGSVDNLAPVPLPAAGALMPWALAGLAGFGARRRRKAQTARAPRAASRLRTLLARGLVLAPIAVLGTGAQAATIALSGSDATGYLSLSNFNNETAEPNSGQPGSKPLAYPYYFDAADGLYKFIVAEGLSADSTYAEEASYTVLQKNITDADFHQFSLGSIGYDESLVSATGTTVIGIGSFTLSLDAGEFSPMSTSRNVNNEFAWDYVLTASNLAGTGLTFVDGTLRSIDLTADLKVDVRLLGNNLAKFNPGFFQANAFSISGNQLAFDFDQTTPQSSLLGPLSAPRLVVTRAGTLDAVAPVPVPAAAPLLMSAVGSLWFAGVRRRRAAASSR